MYAEVNPKVPLVPPPKIDNGERVTYVSVWPDAVVPPLSSDVRNKAGEFNNVFIPRLHVSTHSIVTCGKM